jgi:hypothetical protein
MYEVRIVNGEGERICGPFETMAEAATEKERWQATGGCTVNEIRPARTAAVVFEAPVVAASEIVHKSSETHHGKHRK